MFVHEQRVINLQVTNLDKNNCGLYVIGKYIFLSDNWPTENLSFNEWW